MPKMKTHSASKKRFKKNGSGSKVKRSKAYKRHHAWAKSSKQRRKLRLSTFLKGEFAKKAMSLLPY